MKTSNVSFGRLHIENTTANREALELYTQSLSGYKAISDTFKKIDEYSGSRDIYLDCKKTNSRYNNTEKMDVVLKRSKHGKPSNSLVYCYPGDSRCLGFLVNEAKYFLDNPETPAERTAILLDTYQ